MALKRELNAQLTLYRDNYFPHISSEGRRLRYEAVVGIGGNIGDVRRRFRHLLIFLQREAAVKLHATGPILKNPPFGYLDQDDF